MVDENRIPFDVRDFNKKNQAEFTIEDFAFTQEELKYIPNFVSLDEAQIFVSVLNAGNMITLTLHVEGNCLLKDAHNGEEIPYDLSDSVDVIIAPDNQEENDIFPDSDGIYDLRGSVLALLFDAIPKNYSEVPLETYSKDNYVVMSQEEYEKTHKQKNNSAFDELNSEDFE